MPYTCPTDSFYPNGYGLFNVAGNVAEWCWDWYDPSYYAAGQTDPQGPGSAGNRVLRGGNWSYDAVLARCANRDDVSPDYVIYVGFRCVRGNSFCFFSL